MAPKSILYSNFYEIYHTFLIHILMKKTTLLMLLFLLLSWEGMAQIVDYYSFSETTSTYTEIIGGTNMDITTDSDDGEITSVPIGFSFDYVGTTFSTVTIGVNGALSFTNANVDWDNNFTATATDQINIIAPLWDDLYFRTVDNAEIMYLTSGTAPNRTFTVQWKNLSWRVAGNTVNFQVILSETSNNIQFNYGVLSSTEARTASIGFNNGNSGADFISVTPGAPASTSTATANNLISTTEYPGTNAVYLFNYSAPSCPTPTAQNTNNISTTDVDLGWTTGGASDWIIEWGAPGFTPGSGTVVNTNTNPHNLTGLSPATTYDWYVRDFCAVGDSSNWSNINTFTTLALPPINDNISGAIPLTLGVGACATTVTGTNVGATNSGTTHSCASWNGGDVWFYAIVPTGGAFSVEGTITTGFTDGGMQAYSGPSSALVSINCDDDDSPSGAMPGIYPADGLTGLTPGDTIWLAFWEYGNNSFGDFEICAWGPPTCPAPTAQNTNNITAVDVDLGWTTGGASDWVIEWGAPGFTQGSGTFVNTNTNPHNLAGLSPATTYDWYVRDYCAVGDSSTWVGPLQFTTACIAVVAPWNEDFENAGAIPACWNQGGTNAEDWLFADGSLAEPGHAGNAGTLSGTTVSGNFFAWVDDSGVHNTATTLESPLIDVSGLTTPELSFFLISNNEGNTNVDFSIDVYDGATWNVDFYTHNTNTTNNEWEKIIVNLTSLSITGNLQLRFIVDENNGADFYDDIAIDDVGINEAPTCPAPTALNTTNIAATSADLGWTTGGATDWIIEWGAPGFTQGTGTLVNTSANPHNLTGLSPTTTYDWYVRDYCAVGDSSLWIGPNTFTTPLSCPAPTAQNTTNITATSADLGWITGGATDWIIEWGNPGFAPGSGTIIYTSTNPHSLGALTPSTSYDWYVRDQCSASDSSALTASNTFTTLADNSTCSAPTALSTSAITATSVNLTWTENGTATTWDIELDTAGFTPTGTPTIVGTTNNPTNATGLTGNTSYDFYVRADCGVDGVSAWAGPFNFATNIVGINESAKNLGLSIYPNPNNGVFTLMVKAKNVMVQVMNTTGQVILTKNNVNTNQRFDLSNNAKGIYFITITSKENVTTQKVIVR